MRKSKLTMKEGYKEFVIAKSLIAKQKNPKQENVKSKSNKKLN